MSRPAQASHRGLSVRPVACSGPSTRYSQTSSCSGVPVLAQRERRARRSRSPPRSCRGAGRCPRRRAAARRRARRSAATWPRRSKPANAARKFSRLRRIVEPREPRLEALEAEPLEQAALVANRPAPLLVVVGVVRRVRARPAADDGSHGVRSGRSVLSAVDGQSSVDLKGATAPSDLDLDDAVLDADRERLDRLDGGQRERPAGADVDVRAVPRADRDARRRGRSRPRRAGRRRASSGPRARRTRRSGCRRRP